MSKSFETYNSFLIINSGKTIEVLKFDLDKYQEYGCLSMLCISLKCSCKIAGSSGLKGSWTCIVILYLVPTRLHKNREK